jgi:hypothetical protein
LESWNIVVIERFLKIGLAAFNSARPRNVLEDLARAGFIVA